MDNDAVELARKLAKIQTCLRGELFDELKEHGEDLESVLDPHSYSPLVHELREKYLTRLYLIQGLIQQLAYHSQGGNSHATRVLTVAAKDQNKLVNLVNRELLKLNGAKVMDVKFIPGNGREGWSALITYEANPFTSEFGETAAWM